MRNIIIIMSTFLLFGCDYSYEVKLINKTDQDINVKMHYEKLDDYWVAKLDTNNFILKKLSKLDTIELILKPHGYLLLGSNAGIMDYYNYESLFCDFLEIDYDSTKYTAISKVGLINLMCNFQKGSELGESYIIKNERIEK